MEHDETEKKNSEEGSSGCEEERPGHLETEFTIISIILILAAVAYLAYHAWAPKSEPGFEITSHPAVKYGEFDHVRVDVKNTGDLPAKSVEVYGSIKTSDEPMEAEASLDWLPGNSTRSVTLVFSDASTTPPEIVVRGYEEP